jgi:glycosyltransferase involved in cell wall biosynthesis
LSNWSLRASLVAYYALRGTARTTDAAFFHTQVTSLLSAGLMKQVPSVVSLDATPLQYDALGASYGHQVGAGPVEAVKQRANRRALAGARRLVAWSAWAKSSLVADYGVPEDKVVVIPPGIDLSRWAFARAPKPKGEPLRLLFVGGDFARKGGEALLAAFALLRQRWPDAQLDIVTKSASAGEGSAGVTVYRSIAPNSPELLGLYANADTFVFPTRADCLPLAIMEALAAGLPVVTTAVGALPEAVRHGETGLVAPVDDAEKLFEALHALAGDAGLRAKMGQAAREAACEQFDAAVNYKKIIDLLNQVSR